MLKLKVFGNYAPNLKGLPGSCYLLRGLEKLILLDFGNGNVKKVINEIKKEEIDNLIIILSHNHLDHSLDIFKFAKILKKYKKRVKIYLPKRSFIYYLVTRYKKVFDVTIINEKIKIKLKLKDTIIKFSKNVHSGECYSTKIITEGKVFVYTSDFSFVNEKLKEFCKNADVLLIDSGIPIINKFHLKNFHSNTKKTLKELFSKECNVKKIMASHLKAGLSDENYIRVFPKNKDINLVKINYEYDIFN